MSETTWHYLANQFDNLTVESRKLMNAIINDHRPKLAKGAETDARLQSLLEVLQPAYTAWNTTYGAWKNAQASYHSATLAFTNLLDVLQQRPPGDGRSKIDEWASKVASFWPVNHPIYEMLLPQGREPFTSGSREEIVGEVQRLLGRLAELITELAAEEGNPYGNPDATEQKEAMIALRARVQPFEMQLTAARNVQTEKEGAVDRLSAQVKQARRVAADALYHSLAGLMMIFYKAEDRARVEGYFDLALIMSPPEMDDETPDPSVPPPEA